MFYAQWLQIFHPNLAKVLKQGVEFQVFQQHPNCEKIFLDNEDLAAAVHLLETFVQQIQQRGELFKQYAVKDIVNYHRHNPPQPLPHLILVIDEVHRLFAGTYQQKERFSALLEQVVRQGRAFGIHILLSTQTLAGTQIHRGLMSQITLRISFKLTDSRDAEAIFTYGNTEAVNLAPHELIYNQDAGNKTANVRCRAYPPADIKATLQKVMASRDPALILVPELIKTPTRLDAGSNMAHPAFPAPPAPKPVYGTDSEKALLNQLIQAGKITPPQGFKSAPTDKT